jgi:hypothetical protein
MKALSKFVTIAYAGLGLLLGWLAAIVGFALLTCGIVGAVVGQVIWVVGCNGIAAARRRLERRLVKREGPAPERYA